MKYFNNSINLGNFENLIELKDKTISFDKKSNRSLQNGLWLKLDDEIYYFKSMKNVQYLINDLLGVQVSNYFELPSVHYKLAYGIFNNSKVYGLLSKYERNIEYKYNNLEDLAYGEDSKIDKPFIPTNLSFLNVLEQTYSEEPIVNQLKTLLIRDLVTNETDRKMSEIHIRTRDGIAEIDKVFDYEKEWELLPNTEECLDTNIVEIKEEHITLDYKIYGLLNLTEKDKLIIQTDPIFQKNLKRFLQLDINSLLERLEIEHSIKLSQLDYDYYSLYTETVKTKLKKEKYII